eukprot:scaffold144799_cov256-Phaeocystis_antarctica.AAC.1
MSVISQNTVIPARQAGPGEWPRRVNPIFIFTPHARVFSARASLPKHGVALFWKPNNATKACNNAVNCPKRHTAPRLKLPYQVPPSAWPAWPRCP